MAPDTRTFDDVEAGRILRMADVAARRLMAEPDRFPVDCLPDYAATFVREHARVHGVPVGFLGAAVLAIGSGLIGNRAVIQIKRGYFQPASVWTVLIGLPGSGKSPAIHYARTPLDAAQADLSRQYADEMAAWEDLSKEEREQTVAPVERHLWTADTTVEAIAPLLLRSPGLLILADELAGWLAMDRYRARRGGDRQNYLSMWAGAPVKVTRKSAPTITVPSPRVSVLGGIQPDLLDSLRTEQGGDDGFLDRILPVWCERTPSRWTEEEVETGVVDRYESGMLELTTLNAALDGGPYIITLSDDARGLWANFYDQNEDRNLDGFSAKAPNHLARIAAVIHCMAGRNGVVFPLSGDTLEKAIILLDYFRDQHARMTTALGAGHGGVPTSAAQRLQARVIRALEGAATDGIAKSELHRKLGSGVVHADDLAFVLDDLREAGRAVSEEVPTGGRPQQRWWASAHRHPDVLRFAVSQEVSSENGRSESASEPFCNIAIPQVELNDGLVRNAPGEDRWCS